METRNGLHWVCDFCARGREVKSIGGLARGEGMCSECTRQIGYGGGNLVASPRVVHHTLPLSNVTACGIETFKLIAGSSSDIDRRTRTPVGSASERVTYDFSGATCKACRKSLTEEMPAEEVQAQMADAGWLRTQGEDFKSLRALVAEVNYSEGRLCGDDPPFGAKTRVEFVRTVCSDLNRAQQKQLAGATPGGGLCHEDTATIVRHVRSAIKTLRGDQNAWPDDARSVARNLERTLESLVGVGSKMAIAEFCAGIRELACAGGCGGWLEKGATPGGLCDACQKGADVLRRNARPVGRP